MIGSTAKGMPIRVKAARRGLVTNSITMLPTTVTVLRSATDMLLPTTLRNSSLSADRRDTSSPLRLRSWNCASSPTRCAYNCWRRSATTFSPSNETKKKRDALASANTTTTANTSRNTWSMLPPLLKPSSIMRRNATGKLSVAAEATASAASQAMNRSMCWRTNGHSARNVPSLALLRPVVGSVAGVLVIGAGDEWRGANNSNKQR